MILDKQLSICLNASLVATNQAATIFGDVIDLWGAGAVPTPPVGGPITNLRDLWAGNHPEFFMQMGTALAQSANTVQFDLLTGDTSTGTDITGNVVTLWTSGAVAAATLVAGYRFRVPPVFSVPLGRQRYLGLKYTVTTTAVTAGTLTAGLVWTTMDAPGTFV